MRSWIILSAFIVGFLVFGAECMPKKVSEERLEALRGFGVRKHMFSALEPVRHRRSPQMPGIPEVMPGFPSPGGMPQMPGADMFTMPPGVPGMDSIPTPPGMG